MTARLLIVDDEADTERAKAQLFRSSIAVSYPSELQLDELLAASVVMVDYRLEELWEERQNCSTISLQPLNGLALCSILKAHYHKNSKSPCAFLLRSAHLSDLSPDFNPDNRHHIIAHQNNLEWVFAKKGDFILQLVQIDSLARAIDDLPSDWLDAGDSKLKLMKWLAVDVSTTWAELAWKDIESCHPPLNEIFEAKHGMRLLRWMLHRILPYPCFLWTPLRLAARLRVTFDSLAEALNDGLSDLFSPAEYRGSLCDFDPEVKKRWWGRAIEDVLWELTNGSSFDTAGTMGLLNTKCNGKLVGCDIRYPVICIDQNYQFRNELFDRQNCVQVQPDDWPAYAEQAWATANDVSKHQKLQSIVIDTDSN